MGKQKDNVSIVSVSDALEDIGAALDAVSWEWLETTHPVLANAIVTAVEAGVTPEEVKRYVIAQTYRLELALRCEQAARYLLEG